MEKSVHHNEEDLTLIRPDKFEDSTEALIDISLSQHERQSGIDGVEAHVLLDDLKKIVSEVEGRNKN